MVSPSMGRRKVTRSVWPRGHGLSSADQVPPISGGVCDPGALTELIEEEGILVLLHILRGARLIQKERVDPLDVVYLHLCALRTGRNRQ